MAFTWRVFVLVVSLVCLHASIKTDISLAELWLCPGPDGTEAFTDQGGPGCHKRDDVRPAVPQASDSPKGSEQRVLDIAIRFQLAQIDYEPVHKVLVARCTRSFPASAPSVQTAIAEWQRTNRDPLRELQLLWRNGMAAFRGKGPDIEQQVAAVGNTMTTSMKEKIAKIPEVELDKVCNGGFVATLGGPALDFVALREQVRGKEETLVALLNRVGSGQSAAKRERTSLEVTRQCAQAGDMSCMIQVADSVLSGRDTPVNVQEARDWARKALSKGDQRAGLYLAKAYLSDPNNRFIVDGKADHTKYKTLAHRTIAQRAEQIEALEALAGSAQSGFIPARLLLATLLYEQSGGVPAERVALLLNGLNDLPPVYQTLLKNTQQVQTLGLTHASPRLVVDALTTAVMGAMGQAARAGMKDLAGCKDVKLIKIAQVTPIQDVEWLPLKHPLVANSYPLKGQWTEAWTVMLCKAAYTVPMQFQADGLGGAYHNTKVQ